MEMSIYFLLYRVSSRKEEATEKADKTEIVLPGFQTTRRQDNRHQTHAEYTTLPETLYKKDRIILEYSNTIRVILCNNRFK